MLRISSTTGWPARGCVLAVVLLLSGCSLLFPDTEPKPSQAEPVPAPEPVAQAPEPAPEPAPVVKRPIAPPPLPSVAIVLSSSQPAYADVARELEGRLEKSETYNLGSDGDPAVTILRLINDSDATAVIAIGMRAATSSVAMAEKPVIFSQVFNYQDRDLLTGNSRGVAALPPLDAQFAAWRKIDPSITRIGAIIGPGHDDLIDEARAAAEENGIELRIEVAQSDQETLYLFRRMVRDIDGYLLLPDNRILSPRVLQQMLHDANAHEVAVAVPNEAMLKMGASVSFMSVASDIADTIVRILRRIQEGHLTDVPAITPLSEIHVTTNEADSTKRAVARSGPDESGEETRP
jgi:ABC-type uncharacterized transport system substrate-binding protein